MRLPERDRRAQPGHERERRHTTGPGDPDPHVCLVDERLPDIEDHRVYSHAATRSRSAAVVTLSSRSSPSTIRTRPPAFSTREAQSVAPVCVDSTQARSVEATNACGVWTVTS